MASSTNNFEHVLIISIDGLHNSDLNAAGLQSSLTNIKRLQGEGVTFSNAFSSAPSDSFPGELNYITGADPGTTGVFYDKSYSRTLYAPGTKLADVISGAAKPGTDVEFAENVDKTWADNGAGNNGTLDGGKGFDPSTLPLRYIPATSTQPAQLVPVYPNEYLNVNTIFDVASQAGLTTAWSDKHPAAYTVLAGNDQLAVNSAVKSQLDPTKYNFTTGQVGSITDYSSLEINAAVAIDTTKQGPLSTSAGALVDQSVIPYNASYFDASGKFILPFVNGAYTDKASGNVYYSNAYTKADGTVVTINPNITSNYFNDSTKGNKGLFAAPPTGTTKNQFDSTVTTSTYDDYKVKQILNEIDGLNANGTASESTPAIFGLNIQAVSVAEKDPGTLFNGGGFDANGNPRPDLVTAISHTDQSIGLILDELKKQGLDSSTLVVLTAKHGQNPVQDPTVGLSSSFDSTTGAAGGDGNLTAIGALLARNGIQIASERGGDTSSLIYLKNPTKDLAKAVALLQSTDPNKYSFDTAADKVSDPTGKTLFSKEDFAAQGTVYYGQSAINAGLGDPTKTGTISGDRSPDITVALNTGYFFGNATKKRAEHGGFTDADTHVALIAGSTSLASNLQGTTNSGKVSTKQIAPTTLEALGLDANKLQGVQIDGTKDLGTGLSISLPTVKVTPVGTSGDDNLVAIPGAKFDGLGNNVFTGAGDDTVDLAINPASGNNRINLGSGKNTVYVSKNDRVFGGAGDDVFDATDSKGGNRMSGGGGNDTFFLGFNDKAIGGSGNDKFYVQSGGGNIISGGGAGNDQFWIFTGQTPTASNTILDFQASRDVIGFTGVGSGFGIGDLSLTGNTIALKSDPSHILATLTGVNTSSLTASNFAFV